ncbi:MAG: hypothetical protein PHR53_07290, partial [Bacteroidales bacterium]|nr:hypothetical protein [Bacteroidales bacterium]
LDEAKQQFEKRHESVFNEMSDVNLYNNVITYFLENVKIDFSDEILHRYLNLNRENDQQTVVTDEEFKEYRKAYCQDLLLEKLVKEFDIKVEKEDIRHCAAKRIARYFGTDESAENDYFKSIIDNFLKDEKQVKEFYMEALAEKIILELKSRYKFEQKKVTWEKFQELNQPKVAETTEEQAATTEGKKEKKASKKSNDNQLEMPLD